MAIDPARFDDLFRTIESLRLELNVGAEQLPGDELRVKTQGDAALLLGLLVNSVIQLTHCVRELRDAALEQRQAVGQVAGLAADLIDTRGTPPALRSEIAKLDAIREDAQGQSDLGD